MRTNEHTEKTASATPRLVTAAFRSCQFILLYWISPAVVSLAACAFSQHRASDVFMLSRDHVSSMASSLLGFLGFVTAILVAVLTNSYAQRRRNQGTGFEIFFRALCDLRQLIPEISYLRRSHQPQDVLAKWAQLCSAFTAELSNITPAWRGYSRDCLLEPQMLQYVKSSGNLMCKIANLPVNLRINHEQGIRNMVLGLRIMDEGAVEQELVQRLIPVFFSLAALLILCLAVRTIAGYGETNAAHGFINPFIYVLLPLISIANFAALAWSLLWWVRAIRQRDRMWAS